jgi:peptidoglycan hydrolase-like protein with peptidoglycan-binding domain
MPARRRRQAKQAKIRAGAKEKSTGDNVKNVQDYLERFGYLGTSDPEHELFGAPPPPLAEGDEPDEVEARPTPGRKGTFDEATAEALRRFQEFAGLEVTGEVDEATAEKMNMARCGVPDPAAALAEFTTSGRKWATNNLRYAFQNFTPDIPNWAVSMAVEQAFALWAAYTPLRFTPVPLSAGPEIIISFVAGDHGDGNPFDGPSGVLAHAYYPSVPPAPPTAIMGDAHFDEAETWTVTVPPGGGIDLVTVAAHEFGHSLGLGHSTVGTALMAPFYGGPHRFLDGDDIAGIRSLYGGFSIAHAMWIHGNEIEVEVPGNIESIVPFGFFTRVIGRPNTTNWYHFAIPTAVIVSDRRLVFVRAMLRFITGGANALVRDVHVYDGSARIAAHQFVNLSGTQAFAVFGVPHKPYVFWGSSISVGVQTGGGTWAERRMDFISAGIDFMP